MAQAHSLGVSDFHSSTLIFFVDELANKFASNSLTIKVSPVFIIEVVVDSLVWEIQVNPADTDTCAGFFRHVCMTGFANHSFLVFKTRELEHLIRVRDKYILYLEENYKTVNGSELMQKYRRQHADDDLSAFVRSDVDARIVKQYHNIVDRTDTVGVSLRDAVTWEATETLNPKKKSKLKKESIPKLKMESVPDMEPPKKDSQFSSRWRIGSSPRKRKSESQVVKQEYSDSPDIQNLEYDKTDADTQFLKSDTPFESQLQFFGSGDQEPQRKRVKLEPGTQDSDSLRSDDVSLFADTPKSQLLSSPVKRRRRIGSSRR